MRVMVGLIESSVVIPSMVNMRTMVGIDLVKILVNFLFKISSVTSPALLVPPALKSEKSKS